MAFIAVFLAEINCLALPSPLKLPSSTITKENLENGLTVLIKEDHTHPLVTIMITISAGLSSEGTYSGSGISHFVEHMIFKGSLKRSAVLIEKEVKSYGGTINASTGLDSTNYYITVPKEYTKEALELIEDIVFHPSFDTNHLEKEREVILKEIKLNHDDPTRRIMRQLWETSYLEHPYKKPIIGYENQFKELKREDLINYHLSRYTPQNSIVTVVGDIDKNTVLTEIIAAFDKYEQKKETSISVPIEPQQDSLRSLKVHAEINLAYLAMGYHTVEFTSNDLYALDMLGIILGEWDGSRLNERLVKDEELLYTVSSFNYTPKYPGIFIIYGVGDPEKLVEAKEKILDEVDKIKTYGIDNEELEAAKNIVISNYINSLETTDGIAGAISQSEFLAAHPNFFEKYVENIKKIDGEAIKDVAKKYLTKSNLTISYLYPERNEKKIVLSNGVRLILKEDHRLPKISLVSVFLGGIRAETEENNGISNLTASMLLKGTKKRKEDQIKAFLERRGGQLTHFSGKNTFGLTLDFLREDVIGALDLLEDIIKNPTFPEEELKKEKEKIYAAIKSEDDDVYDVGFLRLQKILFKNHPYALRVIGEKDPVKEIARTDIKDFYEKLCVGNNMVISVVGDFESDRMYSEIEKRFSGIRNMPFNIKVEEPLPFTGIKEVAYSMKREQSVVLTGFRGANLNSPDKYYLQILGSILSGENGRLYQIIRDELGLSYSLGAFSRPGMDAGYFALYVATDKKNLKKAKDILFKELKNMETGEIDEEEINLAKSSLIGRQKIALQTNKSLAYTMALDELYGLGYDAYKDYPEIVSRITKTDIVKAAQKYIDFKSFAIVSILGENEG